MANSDAKILPALHGIVLASFSIIYRIQANSIYQPWCKKETLCEKKTQSDNSDAFVFFCKGFVEALSVVLYGKRNVVKNITGCDAVFTKVCSCQVSG